VNSVNFVSFVVKTYIFNIYVILFNFVGICWERYDTHFPVLQKYVILILCQPCNFSLCWEMLGMKDNDNDHTFKVNTRDKFG
jgi:hypothetical protein